MDFQSPLGPRCFLLGGGAQNPARKQINKCSYAGGFSVVSAIFVVTMLVGGMGAPARKTGQLYGVASLIPKYARISMGPECDWRPRGAPRDQAN